MNVGAFSLSLAVKDIVASKAFYEKLGFTALGGDAEQGWLILKNGEHVLGLFQNMFEKNMLTFNPGWNQSAESIEPFTDIRVLKQQLEAEGVDIVNDAIAGESGSGSFMIEDPDGNPILFDQHC